MTDMPNSFGYTHNKTQLGNVDMEIASVLSFILGLILFGASPPSLAADCSAHSGNYNNIAFALQVSTLTVPRDMPTGGVIYQQQLVMAANSTYQLKCRTEKPLAGDYGARISPAPLGGLVGGGLKGVYETGVKGIGVKWNSRAGDALTTSRMDNLTRRENICGSIGSVGTPAGYCLTDNVAFPRIDDKLIVSLVKTGPVETGVINGSALGGYEDDVSIDGYGSANRGYLRSKVSITGAINVVARTCKAPDVNVPMGRYKVSDFRGVGSEVATQIFRIVLLDCPGFPGTYRAGAVSSESGVVTAAPLSPNYISIQIDPVITPLDASKGILALTPGNGAAKGVGLRISRVGDVNGPITLSQLFPAAGSTSGLAAVLDGSTTSISLDFTARYVKVDEVVAPGKANAVATYTINYQ